MNTESRADPGDVTEPDAPVTAMPIGWDDLVAHVVTGRLYAILDACDAPDVPARVRALGAERGACLYSGSAAQNFGDRAPYLARVDDGLLQWLRSTLGAAPWGLFAVAPANAAFSTVRRQLRRFLRVDSPEREPLLFRYYDPRLVELFLSCCTPTEAADFFGVIEAFVAIQGDAPGRIITLRGRAPGRGVVVARRPVGQLFQLRPAHMAAFRMHRFSHALAGMFARTTQRIVPGARRDELQLVGPVDAPVTIGFDRAGFIGRVTSPLGRTWRMEHDARGHLTGLVTPLGAQVQMSMSQAGELEAVSRDGRQVLRVERDGVNETFCYPDATRVLLQRRVSRRPPASGAEPLLESVRDRIGRTTAFTHGPHDELRTMTNGSGHTTRFEYGRHARPERAVYPDGSWEAYGYRDDGQLESRMSSDGVGVVVRHDDHGRLLSVRGTDGAGSRFEYDAHGRVVEASNDEVTVRLTHDEHGRLVAEQRGAEVVRYAYDARGCLSALSWPDGDMVRYEYDADQRLTRLIDWRGRVFEWSVEAGDRVSSLTAPNDIVTTDRVDEFGLLVSRVVQSRGAAAPTLHTAYAYDEELRLREVRDGRLGVRTFEYDAESQLRAVRRQDSILFDEHFTYDAAGNRSSVEGHPCVFDELDRPVRCGRATYRHDGRGNLIEVDGPDGRRSLRYDAQNRLIRVAGEGGAVTEYGYDAFGRRLWKRSSGPDRVWRETRYTWAGERMIREVIQTNESTRSGPARVRVRTYDYVYLPGTTTPLLQRADDEIFQYHTDHRGVPAWMTDDRGEIVWEAELLGFGAAHVLTADVHQPLRLPGQYHDEETGLHYNRHRYYDPHMGRYLTRDPASYAGGINLYAYCHNNPVNDADALGLWPSWKSVVSVVAGVAAGVVVALLLPEALAVGAVIVISSVVAGAVMSGLNYVLEHGFNCILCLLWAIAKGALIGLVAALPFLALPAAAGILAFAGVGALSGMLGYTTNWLLEGADPAKWSWGDFALSGGIGAVTAGLGRWLVPKLAGLFKGAKPVPPRVVPQAEALETVNNALNAAEVGLSKVKVVGVATHEDGTVTVGLSGPPKTVQSAMDRTVLPENYKWGPVTPTREGFTPVTEIDPNTGLPYPGNSSTCMEPRLNEGIATNPSPVVEVSPPMSRLPPEKTPHPVLDADGNPTQQMYPCPSCAQNMDKMPHYHPPGDGSVNP